MPDDELTDWTPIAALDALPEGKPVRRTVGAVAVFLYRTPERVYALSNLCTHVGGPLHVGRVQRMGQHLSVTCPIHGSMFRLDDGSVIRGPATIPEPVFEVRINGSMVEIRTPVPSVDPP